MDRPRRRQAAILNSSFVRLRPFFVIGMVFNQSEDDFWHAAMKRARLTVSLAGIRLRRDSETVLQLSLSSSFWVMREGSEDWLDCMSHSDFAASKSSLSPDWTESGSRSRTRCEVADVEAIKAGKEHICELRIPNPPNFGGRLACIQWSPSKSMFNIFSKQFSKIVSRVFKSLGLLKHGQLRKKKFSRDEDIQFFKRKKA